MKVKTQEFGSWLYEVVPHANYKDSYFNNILGEMSTFGTKK